MKSRITFVWLPLCFLMGLACGALILAPIVRRPQQIELQRMRLLSSGRQIQLALAAYHADHGHYPRTVLTLTKEESSRTDEKYLYRMPLGPDKKNPLKELRSDAASEAGSFHYGFLSDPRRPDDYIIFLYGEGRIPHPDPIDLAFNGANGDVRYDIERWHVMLTSRDPLGFY